MDASDNKKPRTDYAFLESGECSDEVTFEFDDDQKLYVSQNLLTLSSPVFKAMFDDKSNFKESKERIVKMVEKSFEDVRQFFCCLHPDIQQAVTETNVLVIAPLAEEYQSELLISRCQEVLYTYLESDHQKTFVNAHRCLQILTTVLKLNYEELVNISIEAVARFPSHFFTGGIKGTRCIHLEKGKGECKQVFHDLSNDIKIKLLIQRLEHCDDSDRYY